jgi:hypothetical protein
MRIGAEQIEDPDAFEAFGLAVDLRPSLTHRGAP